MSSIKRSLKDWTWIIVVAPIDLEKRTLKNRRRPLMDLGLTECGDQRKVGVPCAAMARPWQTPELKK